MANLRTPLSDWHVAHKARLVEFGGWDMPVQYTGIIDEHKAVRTACGLFDVSHMGRLSFGGPQALDLIQKVWTNNAATMKDFQVRYYEITCVTLRVEAGWPTRRFATCEGASTRKIAHCFCARTRGSSWSRCSTKSSNAWFTRLKAGLGVTMGMSI